MDYTGIVTSVNYRIYQFTLDKKIEVYAPYMFLNKNVYLPGVNEKIFILNGIFNKPNKIFLQPSSKIVCRKTNKYTQKNDFIEKFIRNYKLGGIDLILIKKLVDYTGQYYPPELLKIANIDVEDLILSLCESCVSNTEKISITNSVLPNITIRTPLISKFIKYHRSNMMYYWTFGVYLTKKHEYFLGYLTYCTNTNTLLLQDVGYKLICITTNENKLDLKDFLNKFIFIKKCFIFSEILCDVTQKSLEYVLCDLKDINILSETNQDIDKKKSEKIQIEILHRSSICFTNQCWLHCKILIDNSKQELLLCLEKELLKYSLVINSGDLYQIESDENLIEKLKSMDGPSNKEIKRELPSVPGYKLPSNCQLSLIERNKINLKNISEVIVDIDNNKNNFSSFWGVIRKKLFWDPLPSRTTNFIKNDNCGTPGIKTHHLILSASADDKNFGNLYLNNWECIQCPYGLIPGMTVAVYYVKYQKNRYFKSTCLTRIEPLQYKPPVYFNTCFNLDYLNWGPKSYLGLNDLVPCDIFIWCRVEIMKIRSLRFYCYCRNCNIRCTEATTCNCDEEHLKLQIKMILTTIDAKGESTVTCSELKVLKMLLNMSEKDWKKLLEFMLILKHHYFNHQIYYYMDKFNTDDIFLKSIAYLDFFLNLINLNGLNGFDLKCRRMPEIKKKNIKNFWLCVDIRKEQLTV